MDYDFFIIYASEDKIRVARPLADHLVEDGFRVWYDEFSLRIGDSLRRKIDEGLASCRYGIVIFSHNFFAKKWPQDELSALFSREGAEERKIILPVWHEIDAKQMARYSPLLADRIGARTAKGIKNVIGEIRLVVKGVSRKPMPPSEPMLVSFPYFGFPCPNCDTILDDDYANAGFLYYQYCPQCGWDDVLE